MKWAFKDECDYYPWPCDNEEGRLGRGWAVWARHWKEVGGEEMCVKMYQVLCKISFKVQITRSLLGIWHQEMLLRCFLSPLPFRHVFDSSDLTRKVLPGRSRG